MANVKISDLPAASSAAGTDQLETNQGGTSRRLTVAQVATHVRSTATDTVVVAAGSAAAPSIAPTGDSNTGIFFPAADTIAFSEGGVEALRLDSSGNATFAGTAAMASSFLRNRIINGGMEIAQRGTSGTSGYLLDRWVALNTSAQSQTTDAPPGFINSVEFTSSSATFPLVAQRIERANSYDLAGRTVTLSFWARSLSGSANLFVEAYRANTNDNFSSVTLEVFAIVSASPSTSWTFYSVSFPLSASATTGIEVRIIRNNASAASTRVTGVQLEVGSVATPFERRQFGQELALCQRYFQSYAASTFRMDGNAASGGVSVSGITFSFHTQMRATPTATGAYSSTVNIGNGPFFGVTVNGTNIGANASSGGTTSMIMGAMTFAAEL